jgi:hypothetical protein
MNNMSNVFALAGNCFGGLVILGMFLGFPVWVAIRAYTRGNTGWMIATLLTIPLALAPVVALFALIAMPSAAASGPRPSGAVPADPSLAATAPADPQALGTPSTVYKGVSVHPGGLSYANGGRTQVVRWDDVNMLWYRATRVQGMFTVQTCTLELRDGSKHNFGNNDKLNQVIQVECTRRILPRVLASYQAGAPVSFGKLTLSKAGIGKRQETLPWDQVKRVNLDQGILSIWKQGGLFKWAEVYVAQTPNFWVLAYLVGSEAGAALKRRLEAAHSVGQMISAGEDLNEAKKLQAFGASLLASPTANS